MLNKHVLQLYHKVSRTTVEKHIHFNYQNLMTGSIKDIDS